MHWSKREAGRRSNVQALGTNSVRHTAASRILAVLLAVLILLPAAFSTDEKRISIYAPTTTYSLPVLDRNNHDYVGLLEILDPLGRVTAKANGQHWKLRFNDLEADFVAGKTRVKLHGHNVELGVPFLSENGRGLVPLSSLGALLPQFLGPGVNFRENARRLFLGDVATKITAQLDSANPPRLTLNFSNPVNPTLSTEPGKLRMVFTRDPVLPPSSQPLIFDNKSISQITFTEDNGGAELIILSAVPLMANFSNSGRTITVTAPTPPAPAPVAVQTPTPVPSPQQSVPAASGRRILVVVDPAHGGDDRGASLGDQLAEKDVTLGFGRLLRHELEIRGVSVLLLRDGDSNPSLDQRAITANAAHAAAFVSLHAASQGNGVRVYWPLLPAGESKGVFHTWNAAQTSTLSLSHDLATAVAVALQKRQLSPRAFSASLRPLNNVMMPAIAVELAPGPNGVADLPSAKYQQIAAAAVAEAIASMRDQVGARQ